MPLGLSTSLVEALSVGQLGLTTTIEITFTENPKQTKFCSKIFKELIHQKVTY